LRGTCSTSIRTARSLRRIGFRAAGCSLLALFQTEIGTAARSWICARDRIGCLYLSGGANQPGRYHALLGVSSRGLVRKIKKFSDSLYPIRARRGNKGKSFLFCWCFPFNETVIVLATTSTCAHVEVSCFLRALDTPIRAWCVVTKICAKRKALRP
jgi:hypothetical protein